MFLFLFLFCFYYLYSEKEVNKSKKKKIVFYGETNKIRIILSYYVLVCEKRSVTPTCGLKEIHKR